MMMMLMMAEGIGSVVPAKELPGNAHEWVNALKAI
jgi:hypothetical protein